jgi:hypothetical protein
VDAEQHTREKTFARNQTHLTPKDKLLFLSFDKPTYYILFYEKKTNRPKLVTTLEI